MPNTFNVYFAVWGEWLEPALLSSIIGREPDDFLPKGTVRGRAKVAARRSVWRIVSGRLDTDSIEQQLEALLSILEQNAVGVRRAVAEHRAGINCAAYWHTSQPGFHLSESIIARVAALNLSLDFDMYCLGDEDETGG